MADDTLPFMFPDGSVKSVPSAETDKWTKLGGQRAIAFNTGDGRQKWVPQTRVKEFLDHGGYVANASDLTVNPGNEGTYRMGMPGSNAYAAVPYSMIGSASKLGYQMHPDDRKKYVDDAAADPNLNANSNLPKGTKIVGRNTAGQPIYGEDKSQKFIGTDASGKQVWGPDASQPQGSVLERFMNSAGNAVESAAKGAYHGVVEGPQNAEEADIEANHGGRPAMLLHRLFIQPALAQADQAKQEAAQANLTAAPWNRTEEQKRHGMLAAGHALASVIPRVGPWAAQVGEQVGEQAGSGDVAGAAGTLLGNAVVYETPHAATAAVKGLAGLPKTASEAITGTGPRTIAEMAKKTEAENAAATQSHAEKAQEAANTVTDKERDYNRQLAVAAENARQQHQQEIDKVAEDNARMHAKAQADHQAAVDEVNQSNERIHAKAQADHQAEVNDVNEFNNRVNQKHQQDVQRTNEENAALGQMLDLRNSTASDLDSATKDYFDEEAKVRTDAKKMENEAWDEWRKKTNSAKTDVDATPLVKVIEEQLTATPDARTVLSQVDSSPGALDPASQQYIDTRDSVMKDTLGYDGAYEDLPETGNQSKATVDEIMSRIGVQKPINLAVPTDIHTLTLEEIHNLKSNIGYKRWGRNLEPGTRGALTNIYNALSNLETAESSKLGAGTELGNAKDLTQKFQKSFGQPAFEPLTNDQIRMREANPDEFKDQQSQKRVNAASVWSNKLVDLYDRVKSLREKLKSLPEEDKLRKQIQQVPAPPTEGDLRPGYNLKSQPVYQPPTEGDLRPGYNLKSQPVYQPPTEGDLRPGYNLKPMPEPINPEEIARQKASQKQGDIEDLGPNRPEGETISPEDIAEEKQARVQKTANRLQEMGIRRALFATLSGLSFGAAEHFKIGASVPTAVASGLLAGMTVLAGVNKLIDVLEKPGVAKWLSSVTPDDIKAYRKLPPEQQALFTDDMRKLVQEADKHKMPVSQNLRAFIAGTAATQGKQTPEELKKQAEERWKQVQAQTPTVSNPQPSPNAGAYKAGPAAVITHVYDPTTGTIVAVQ